MSQAGIYSTGVIPPSSSAGFGQVYNQGAQTINNNATFTFDSNGPLVNITHVAGSDTVTVNTTGTFLIRWMINCQGTGGNITLLQNGVKVNIASFVTNAGAFEPIGEGVVNAVSGDTFQLKNTTGVMLTADHSAGFTNLSMTFEKLPSGGASSGASSFPTDSGTANQAGGVLNINGDRDINTTGAANTVTIHLDNNISLGDLSVITTGNDALTVMSGNITLSGTGVNAAGNINMPICTVSRLGVINKGGTRFLHDYNGNGGASGNTFVGNASGNFTLTSGSFNTGVGDKVMQALTTGSHNTALGESALIGCTSGIGNTAFGDSALETVSANSGNTCLGFQSGTLLTGGANTSIGQQALGAVVGGGNNIALGYQSALSYVGSESSNIIIGNSGTAAESNVIRIGTSGSGTGQQNSCFIAGIDGVNVGSVARVVTEASNQLGTAVITAGAGIVVTPGANTITISSIGGGATWSVITVNQTAAVDNGYFCNKAGTLALALPAVSAVGDEIEVVNINTALGAQMTQAAGQQIFVGNTNTTLGATGTLTSSAVGDSLRLICRAANTTWQVVSMIGNWTPA